MTYKIGLGLVLTGSSLAAGALLGQAQWVMSLGVLLFGLGLTWTLGTIGEVTR